MENLVLGSMNKVLSKDNDYDMFLEKIVKMRQDNEKKAKEFLDKYHEAISTYEREHLTEYFRMINGDISIKKKIIQDKGEFFKHLTHFEESLLNYFNEEIADMSGFTKIPSKQFDMSSKVVGKTVTIKFETELEANIVDIVSLIYETGKYPMWFPFCSAADILNQPGKAKKLVYMISSIPVIANRDFLIYGFGINQMAEDRSILILCRSIEESSGIFKEEYRKKSHSKNVRGIIKVFGFKVSHLGANKVRVKGLMNFDPKVKFLPQSLINMVGENFAGDLFKKFVKISKNYKNSEYYNHNPSKIDQEFYKFVEAEMHHYL